MASDVSHVCHGLEIGVVPQLCPDMFAIQECIHRHDDAPSLRHENIFCMWCNAAAFTHDFQILPTGGRVHHSSQQPLPLSPTQTATSRKRKRPRNLRVHVKGLVFSREDGKAADRKLLPME